jgi:hypothetical protein
MTDMGIAGKEDLSLNVREGFGENGDGRRLLVFARDGCKGLVLLLAYTSVDAFSLGEIFGQVPQMSRGFCGRGAAGVVTRGAAGGAAGVVLSAGLPCGLLWGALVSCWCTF